MRLLSGVLRDAWGVGSSKRFIGMLMAGCLVWISIGHPASDALVTILGEITMACIVGITSERFSRALPKPGDDK